MYWITSNYKDLREFYKIQEFLKDNKSFNEMIWKSKGLYYKNPEKYI